MSRTQYAYRINTEEAFDQIIIAPTIARALSKWNQTAKRKTAQTGKNKCRKRSAPVEVIRCMGQVVGIVK